MNFPSDSLRQIHRTGLLGADLNHSYKHNSGPPVLLKPMLVQIRNKAPSAYGSHYDVFVESNRKLGVKRKSTKKLGSSYNLDKYSEGQSFGQGGLIKATINEFEDDKFSFRSDFKKLSHQQTDKSFFIKNKTGRSQKKKTEIKSQSSDKRETHTSQDLHPRKQHLIEKEIIELRGTIRNLIAQLERRYILV